MNKSKIEIRILFEDYWIKIVLDGLRSFALTTGEIIDLALKKLKSRFRVCPNTNYGLFEKSKGIERLIPDEVCFMRNRAFLSSKSEFIIRPKSYFETHGHSNSNMTNERIKKCYRKLSKKKISADNHGQKENNSNDRILRKRKANDENDNINQLLSAKVFEHLVSETNRIVSNGFQVSITKKYLIIEEENVVAIKI